MSFSVRGEPWAGVLENVRRRRVLETVRSAPGLHASGLARRVGVSRVVAQHHLRILAAFGLVRERRAGRSTHYFPAGVAHDPPDVLVALSHPTRRRIAEALAEAGGAATQRDLALRTGLVQTLVSYHLRILEREGLLRLEGGLPRRYVPSAPLAAALASAARPTRLENGPAAPNPAAPDLA